MAINLVKGQKIDLTKKETGTTLSNVCVGLNWGAIEKPGFLGIGTKKIEVDLDASCILLDKNKEIIDVVYYGQLTSQFGGIVHSGDDLTGDMDGDDGLDNEIISVNLDQLPEFVDQIVFCLNSYKKQDFADIPFASIRIFEGSPNKVNSVFANFDVAHGAEFSGKIAMIMGKFYRRNGNWKFSAIGEPTADRDLKDTLGTIVHHYA